MKVILKMEKLKEKGLSITIMMINMEEVLWMVRKKGKEFIFIKMELSEQGIILMISQKENHICIDDNQITIRICLALI